MIPHPSVTSYNKGCRCTECRAEIAAYRREYKARKASGDFIRRYKKFPAELIPHGTTTGYNHHKCRCEPCRKARSDYQRAIRVQRARGEVQSMASSVSVEPLWARIESAAGCRISEMQVGQIADMCGVTRETIFRWRASGVVSLRTTDRVAVALGWHPAAIWGADWYIETASRAA